MVAWACLFIKIPSDETEDIIHQAVTQTMIFSCSHFLSNCLKRFFPLPFAFWTCFLFSKKYIPGKKGWWYVNQHLPHTHLYYTVDEDVACILPLRVGGKAGCKPIHSWSNYLLYCRGNCGLNPSIKRPQRRFLFKPTLTSNPLLLYCRGGFTLHPTWKTRMAKMKETHRVKDKYW